MAITYLDEKQSTITYLDESTVNKESIMSNIFRQSVQEPATEVYRGYLKGTENFYATLDFIPSLLEKAGAPTTNIFENAKNQMVQMQQDIPETQMHAFPKTIYQMIGESPEAISKFLLLKKLPGMDKLTQFGGEAFSDTAAIAIDGALREYANSDELMGLARGARSGAMIGLAFPIAGKALQLMGKYGKKAAKTFIKVLTKNEKLANDFVNNPQKYNVNPFAKVESIDDIQKANKRKVEELKIKRDNALEDLRVSQTEKKALLNEKTQDAKFTLRMAQTEANEMLKEGSAVKLSNVTKMTDDAITKMNETLQANIVNTYDDFLKKINVLRNEKGKAVQEAIEATIATNPLVGVKYSEVADDVYKVIKNPETSPFKIVRARDARGRILKDKFVAKSRTAASADQKDVEVFNRIYDEFTNFRNEGKLTLTYLQDLKGDLQSLSQQAYSAGKNKLGTLYRDFSRSVNPANLIEHNPRIAKRLTKLANANKAYSDIMPRYQEAIKQFFKEDANGNLIPNITKAVHAIQNKDEQALRLMRQADSLLPANERMLPKIQRLVTDYNEHVTGQKQIVKSMRRKLQQEKTNLIKRQKQEFNKLVKERKASTMQEKLDLRAEFIAKRKVENEKLQTAIDALNKYEEFMSGQALLRSPIAKGEIPRLIQHVAGFGALAAAGYGNIGKTVGSTLVGASLAPMNVANLYKGGFGLTSEGQRLIALLEQYGGRNLKPLLNVLNQ